MFRVALLYFLGVLKAMSARKTKSKETIKNGESMLPPDFVAEHKKAAPTDDDWNMIFSPVKAAFVPNFNELDAGMLFLLSMLTLYVDAEAREIFTSMLWSKDSDIWGVVAVAFFIIWGLKALFHNFVTWEKSKETKKSMVYFASICCGLSWVFSSFFCVREQGVTLGQIFGIFNLLQGVALLVLARFGYMDHQNLDEGDTPLPWAIMSISLIACLFFTLRNGFGWHTAEAYATCVTFVMNFSGYICKKAVPPKEIVLKRPAKSRKS